MLLTFIKLPFVIKISVLSISEWPLYTGFTAHVTKQQISLHIMFIYEKTEDITQEDSLRLFKVNL